MAANYVILKVNCDTARAIMKVDLLTISIFVQIREM